MFRMHERTPGKAPDCDDSNLHRLRIDPAAFQASVCAVFKDQLLNQPDETYEDGAMRRLAEEGGAQELTQCEVVYNEKDGKPTLSGLTIQISGISGAEGCAKLMESPGWKAIFGDQDVAQIGACSSLPLPLDPGQNNSLQTLFVSDQCIKPKPAPPAPAAAPPAVAAPPAADYTAKPVKDPVKDKSGAPGAIAVAAGLTTLATAIFA